MSMYSELNVGHIHLTQFINY